MKNNFFYSFDNSKICYQYKKKGSMCLLFLHGLGGDLTAWNPERTFFEELGYSTVAIDLRGHGLSEKSDSKEFYDFINFAQDIEFFIQKNKFKKVILVGHCFGGMVSLYIAARKKVHLDALILIDTSYKPPVFLGRNKLEQGLLRHVVSFLAFILPNVELNKHVDFTKYIGTEDIDIKRFTSDVLHSSVKGYLLVCEKLTGYNTKKLLDLISVPTLVLEGEEDSIFPPEISKYISKRIKRSKFEMIPEANHILVINNPYEVNNSIDEFLDTIEGNTKNE